MSRASRERVLVPCMCIPTCTLALCSSHLHTCIVLFPPAHCIVLFPPAHLRCALPTCTLHCALPTCTLHCALPTCTLALCSSHLHTCIALFPPAHCIALFPPAHLHCALCMCVSCSHCFAVWRTTTYCTSVPPHRLD